MASPVGFTSWRMAEGQATCLYRDPKVCALHIFLHERSKNYAEGRKVLPNDRRLLRYAHVLPSIRQILFGPRTSPFFKNLPLARAIAPKLRPVVTLNCGPTFLVGLGESPSTDGSHSLVSLCLPIRPEDAAHRQAPLAPPIDDHNSSHDPNSDHKTDGCSHTSSSAARIRPDRSIMIPMMNPITIMNGVQQTRNSGYAASLDIHILHYPAQMSWQRRYMAKTVASPINASGVTSPCEFIPFPQRTI